MARPNIVKLFDKCISINFKKDSSLRDQILNSGKKTAMINQFETIMQSFILDEIEKQKYNRLISIAVRDFVITEFGLDMSQIKGKR